MPILVKHNRGTSQAAIGLAGAVGGERQRQIDEAEGRQRQAQQLTQQLQAQQFGLSSGQQAFQQAIAREGLDIDRQRLAMEGDRLNANDAYRNAALDQRGQLATQRNDLQRYGIEQRASTRLKVEAMEAEQMARRFELQGQLQEAQYARQVSMEKMKQAGRLDLAEKRQSLKQQAAATVQRAGTSNNAALRAMGLKLQAATIKLHALENRKEQMLGMDDPALDADLQTAMGEINSIMGEISMVQNAPLPGPAQSPVQGPTQVPATQPTTQPATQPAAPSQYAAAPTTQPVAPVIPVGATATNPATGQKIRFNGSAWELVEQPTTMPATRPATQPATMPVAPPQSRGVITAEGRQSVIPSGSRYGDAQRDQLDVSGLHGQFEGMERVVLEDGTVLWRKPDGSFIDNDGNPVELIAGNAG